MSTDTHGVVPDATKIVLRALQELPDRVYLSSEERDRAVDLHCAVAAASEAYCRALTDAGEFLDKFYGREDKQPL